MTRNGQPSGPAAPAGERRFLTVMFADLVGSTAMADQLDPEEYIRVLHVSRGICQKAINHYGGYVAKFMGDGILACFGYPHATEHNAQRAVNAGVEMVEGHKTARWDLPEGTPRPALRVGVHSGLVVIADIEVQGGMTEYEALIGATSNLASRIHGEAPPDGVVVSDSCLQDIRANFKTVELGPRVLKGLEKAIVLHRVTDRCTGARISERVDHVRHVPMVGRDAELRVLCEGWAAARAGEDCRPLLVTGEAGMGKSRLVAEFLRNRAERDQSYEVFLQCSPYDTSTSFHPVRRWLSAALRLDNPESTADEELQQRLMQAGLDPEECALLGVGVFGMLEKMSPQSMGVSPDVRKTRTFAALDKLVAALIDGRPTVMVFNDVHWSDELTRDWLSRLGESGLGRVFVVVTVRPEEERLLEGMEVLVLRPLELEHMRVLIRHVAHGKVLPSEVAVQITRRTRGVPLFAVEMTRALLASGMLQEFDTYFGSNPGVAPADWATVPLTLQELLLRRVEAVGEARAMLQLCAVLGEDFPAELAVKIWQSMGQSGGEAHLLKLEQLGLLEHRDGNLAFGHALLRSVAYEGALKSRRMEMHCLIARHLESFGDQALAVDPATVANHYRLAGMGWEAADFSLRAARACIARSACVDAIAQAKQGLGIVEERIARNPELRILGVQLATLKGLAEMTTLGYSAPEVDDAFRRAESFCQSEDAPELRFPVQWGLWVVALMKAKLPEAVRRSKAMMEIGHDSGDDAFLIEGLWTCGVALFYQGRLAESRDFLERAVALYRPAFARNALIHGQDPGVAARTYLMFVLCFQGHVREAEAMAETGLALARKLGHAHTLTWALGGSTMLRLGLGDLAGTLRIGREAMLE